MSDATLTMPSWTSLIPASVRRGLRAAHRRLVFDRAMRAFLADPYTCTHPDSSILRDLVYGWGNPAWSAREEFLTACIAHSLTTRGPILECGSGLSTVLVGTIAVRRGIALWTLEHSPPWGARVQRILRRYGARTTTLCTIPLRSWADYDWYDAPLDRMPRDFSLVLCDGPPGDTPGGRYGLVPVMRERFAPNCLILLDDVSRASDLAIAERWRNLLRGSLLVQGTAKPYVEWRVTSNTLEPQ